MDSYQTINNLLQKFRIAVNTQNPSKIQELSNKLNYELNTLAVQRKINDQEFHERNQFINKIKYEMRSLQTPKRNLFEEESVDPPEPEVQNLHQYVRQNIREQDQYLDQIGASMDTLKQISQNIGDEVEIQNKLLDDLSKQSEDTTKKIRDGSKHIDKVQAEKPSRKTELGIIAALAASAVCLFGGLIHL